MDPKGILGTRAGEKQVLPRIRRCGVLLISVID
uniref:Uncharacterized protein n=1 Tax=Anguilla anguilla TaxID=7936 RepID=A0A0E9TA38_ANGAN